MTSFKHKKKKIKDLAYRFAFGEVFSVYNDPLELRELWKKIDGSDSDAMDAFQEKHDLWICDELDYLDLDRAFEIVSQQADDLMWFANGVKQILEE